eukprot:4236707-Prymnesium_polylepis.1
MTGGRLDVPSTPPRTGCGPRWNFTARVRAARAGNQQDRSLATMPNVTMLSIKKNAGDLEQL